MGEVPLYCRCGQEARNAAKDSAETMRRRTDENQKLLQVSTVTEGNTGSTFALRRPTLDFCLGGQRWATAFQQGSRRNDENQKLLQVPSARISGQDSSHLAATVLLNDSGANNGPSKRFWYKCRERLRGSNAVPQRRGPETSSGLFSPSHSASTGVFSSYTSILGDI